MQNMKKLMIAALVASSLTSIPAPAMAAPANGTTQANMAFTCANELGGKVNVADVLHDGTPVWSTTVVITGEVEGASVETSRDIDEGSRIGTGAYTLTNLSLSFPAGGPFRIGGSVNMFGDQVATNKNWANSEYDYTGHYDITTNYTFGCEVTQQTEHYVEPVYGPGKPGGSYINNGTNPSGNEGSCQGLNPNNPHWGQNLGNCTFVGDGTTIPGELISEGYWVNDGPVRATQFDSAGLTDSQVDQFSEQRHEYNGEPFTELGNWYVGQVVVCISPSTGTKKGVPGEWRPQNGYSGEKCNTAYFNAAPWGGGSQTSNGTYISVPAI